MKLTPAYRDRRTVHFALDFYTSSFAIRAILSAVILQGEEASVLARKPGASPRSPWVSPSSANTFSEPSTPLDGSERGIYRPVFGEGRMRFALGLTTGFIAAKAR